MSIKATIVLRCLISRCNCLKTACKIQSSELSQLIKLLALRSQWAVALTINGRRDHHPMLSQTWTSMIAWWEETLIRITRTAIKSSTFRMSSCHHLLVIRCPVWLRWISLEDTRTRSLFSRFPRATCLISKESLTSRSSWKRQSHTYTMTLEKTW